MLRDKPFRFNDRAYNSFEEFFTAELGTTAQGTSVVVNEGPLNVMDSRFGAVGNNSNDDAPAIQAALDLAATSNQPSEVVLPGRTFKTDSPIKHPQRVTVRGTSPGSTDQSGTVIKPSALVTSSAWQTKNITDGSGDWWHEAGLFDIQIQCSNMNAAVVADGVELYRLGEVSTANRVYVGSAPRHGVHIRGDSTPMRVGFFSVHSNGRGGTGSGLYVAGSINTHNMVDYVAGDNNATALVEVNNLTRATFYLGGFKGERWTASPGNPDVLRLVNGNGGSFIVGAGRVHKPNGVANGTAIINNVAQPGATCGKIQILGSIEYDSTANYDYDYREDNAGTVYTVAWNTIRGRSCTFHASGQLGFPFTGQAVLEMQRINGSVTAYLFGAKVPGDSNFRFRADVGGTVEWGDGTTLDTNLKRSAANILKTDDKLIAALGLGVGNSAAATTPGTVTKKMEVFDASGNSLGFVPIYDAIT